MKGQIAYRQFPTILLAFLVCNALFVGFMSRSPEIFAPDPATPSPANLEGRGRLTGQSAKLSETHVREAYGQLPLSFEMNVGQTDDRVRFLARGAGYSLFLTGQEAVLSLRQGGSVDEARNDRNETQNVLRMRLMGANKASAVTGEDEQEGKSNYFIGNDPSTWRTNVAHYGKVRYAQVYDGVDQVYYGNQGQLEYDFVLAPQADYQQIRLSFDGVRQHRLDQSTGELVLTLPEGNEVRQKRPVAYQEIDGAKRAVTANYVVRGKQEIGFVVGEYDLTKPLVIDPVLVYSTYLGGSDIDQGNAIAVNSAGNAFVTGLTNSTNFPTLNPIQSTKASTTTAFVTKINAAGSALVYSTYLGGNGNDQGLAIAVDAAGNAYVTGVVRSTNFPTVGPIQAVMGGVGDVFVTKINVAGSALVYSTYLGGSQYDQGAGIAVDSASNAYVTGSTRSTNFPTAGPIQAANAGFDDAFALKVNAAGSALVYSTYLGGSPKHEILGFSDFGQGIAIDSSGNAYITGRTYSTNFPTASPIQAANAGSGDVFVTKINAAGSAFLYSTYLGGSGSDGALGIAVDSSGSAYITGLTSSTNFPTATPIQPANGGSGDAFVTKINAAGSALVYSTYLGGNGSDEAHGIRVDSSGNAYIIGITSSTNFPTAGPIQAANGTNTDAFVMKISDGAAPTPTPTPTPTPAGQWQPVVLTAQQVDQLKAWTLGGRTFVYVKPKFPDAGYRIAAWGTPSRTANDFTVNASVEKFTGSSIQAVVTTAQIYDLGPLTNGTYNFNFRTSGTLSKSLQFTVGGTAPPPNPIDNQMQFVRQQYLDFLNREPDAPGWAFWTDNITKCADPARRPASQTEAVCISRQRETTSAAFFISPEFQNTGYFVLRVFRGSLGRFPFFGGSVPVDNSKDEFTRDHATVSSGIVVNNQLDPAVINANKQAFVNQFVGRAEFLAIYGALGNAQYVDKLFQTTAVTPTPAERTALINGLTNMTETRASVLFKIVDGTQTGAGGALTFQTRYGQVFYQQQFNPAFVQMEYFGYMKRDQDEAGYAFWLNKLNAYPSFVEAEMVLAFISSPEYRARFGQP
jgi:beta-propeller repeat-containing protein/uncharacterized protein DUF4214